MRKLVLTKATGVCAGEATSQMQLNWRRVKKEYFSVYLFRSAVTANAVRRRGAAEAAAKLGAAGVRPKDKLMVVVMKGATRFSKARK